MKGKRILIVEDNRREAEAIDDWLTPLGCIVTQTHSGASGLAAVKKSPPDVIVLDIIMAEEDEGFEVLKGLRADPATRVIPVVVFSVTGDQVENRIKGLRLGAYYYLLKTKSLIELQALIERALAIAEHPPQPATRNGRRRPLDFDEQSGVVWIDGQAMDIKLTPLQSDMLAFMIERAGQICQRDEIAICVYHAKATSTDAVSNASIDRLVSRLRAKLGDDPHKPRFIRSVRGRGYQLLVEAAGLAEADTSVARVENV
jgi:DNA-binding response OmpR family regulator